MAKRKKPGPKKESARPAVFMFQPTAFKKVQGAAGLRRWEKLMRERVGLTVPVTGIVGGSTLSTCNGFNTDD